MARSASASREPDRHDRTDPSRGEHYCLVDTAIGACGLAWSARGLTRMRLPGADRRATESGLRRRAIVPGEPPPPIAKAAADLQLYFTGSRVDFADVELDLAASSPFDREVYLAARTIGWGETARYGDLARRVGAPAAAREVGSALAKNPVAIIVPCHRIVATGNKLGGFSAPGGRSLKARLLHLEGALGDQEPLPGSLLW